MDEWKTDHLSIHILWHISRYTSLIVICPLYIITQKQHWPDQHLWTNYTDQWILKLWYYYRLVYFSCPLYSHETSICHFSCPCKIKVIQDTCSQVNVHMVYTDRNTNEFKHPGSERIELWRDQREIKGLILFLKGHLR